MSGITLQNQFHQIIPPMTDAHPHVYVAKILGSHPDYVFARQFLDLECSKSDDGWNFWADLDGYGVYEFSLKWYRDHITCEADKGCMVRFMRWFMVIDGYIDHEIHARKEVLPELRKLKKYIREQELGEDDGGDVA